MTLRDTLLASFHAVGTGTLRLDPESAAAFASHVAAANDGIHVIGQLCTAPNALRSETQALAVAHHVREAAAAFFALEQKCWAPDRHTQRTLSSVLRAALGQPLDHATEAARAFLGANEA